MGKCSHSMASSTLERCSLHGWILVFTVQGRWQTACMASCGWVVCQRYGSSGPWWRWGYGMGRRMLWTTNTGAFYWCHFESHRNTVTRSWGPLLCHSSTTITSLSPFRVAFYYGQHTCAIIMLSNQHLDMPHLWGGWIISAKEKCSLTQI